MFNKLYSTDDCVGYSILHMKQLFGIASFFLNSKTNIQLRFNSSSAIDLIFIKKSQIYIYIYKYIFI